MFEEVSEKAIVGTLILLGWEILAIGTIVNIVMKSRSAASAWGWSMAVLALPFITVPLYWIFGRYQFKGYLERLREARDKHEEAYRDHVAMMTPHYALLEGDEARYGGVLEKITERRFTRGNEVCLLIDGDQTFGSIFAAIEAAQSYVLVQFFIVHDDDLGNRFRELLERKARGGVGVYFVYDEIGSHKISKRYLRSLREAGVEIHPFHSTQGPSNRFQINFRNHRKIVVVDGRVGFVGGHNVGDEYLGKSKRFGFWRDTHVRLAGPCVQSLQMIFLSDYYWATRQVPDIEGIPVAPAEGEGCGGGPSVVLPLPTGPVGPIEGGTIFFLNAITRARHRFWIATPYFVTDESIRSALQMAALRGVDVRVMIPGKPDKWVPWLATFSFLAEMEAAGVKVFRYEKGFLHQKVLVVDDYFSGVGTANLDNRSMRLNFEVIAVVLCEDFAKQVEAMLEVDFAHCREVGASDYSSRPWWFRLGVRVARLFSPIL